jgi:hypothetical protein
MKRSTFNRLGLAAATAVALPMASQAADDSSKTQKTTAPVQKLYRHAVFLKFKDDASPEAIKAVVDAFVALKAKIPAIQALEWGKNVSPENLNQGLTHAFFLTFASKESLEKDYLHHADHVAFGGILKPVLDKVLVVDYVVE